MNRRDYYYLMLLGEAELDDGFEQSEVAQRNIVADAGLVGVAAGLSVTQHSPTPDLTIDIAAGTAYTSAGERVQIPTLQVENIALDHLLASTAVTGGAGYEKIVSVFLEFDRSLSDPQLDGNTNTVFFIRDETFSIKIVQGAETNSLPATPPALEAGKILLADIRISNAQTQIFNTDITPPGGSYSSIANRREDTFVLSAGAISIMVGTAEESDQAILTELNGHITGASNVHAASAVAYSGGGVWADATTNPAADVETQLDKIISDLGSFTAGNGGLGGAGLIGINTRTVWLGGRTNTQTLLHSSIDKIIIDLSAQSAADDGMERVGGEARTGADYNLALGSAASQAQAIIDNVGHAGAHTYSNSGTAIELTGDGDIQLDGLTKIITASTAEFAVYDGGTAAADLRLQLSMSDEELNTNALDTWQNVSDDATDWLFNRGQQTGTGVTAAADTIFTGQTGRAVASGTQNNGGDIVVNFSGVGGGGTAGTGINGGFRLEVTDPVDVDGDTITGLHVVKEIAIACNLDDGETHTGWYTSPFGALASGQTETVEMVIIANDLPAVVAVNAGGSRKYTAQWGRDTASGIYASSTTLWTEGAAANLPQTVTATHASQVPTFDVTRTGASGNIRMTAFIRVYRTPAT